EIPLALTGWPVEVIGTIAFIITLVLVSYLHVVFGEMVPKNIAFSVPDRAALLLAPPLVWVSRVFGFVIVALNATANGVLRLFGVEPKNEATSAYTIDEVANIVAQSQREGVLRDDSGALSAAFEFTEKQAKDVAIPLDKIVSLTEGVTPARVARAVAQHGFSRYVLVNGDGFPTGYLHLKDVIDLDSQEQVDAPVPTKRVRRLVSIAESTELEDVLTAMRRSGVHLATVYDEVGEPRGVLFLE